MQTHARITGNTDAKRKHKEIQSESKTAQKNKALTSHDLFRINTYILK